MPTARCRALLVGALAVAGCSGAAEQPDPTPLSKESALVDPPKRPPRTGPFRNPNVDPPDPRSGAQLDEAALETALAEARALIEAGETNPAILKLRPCANKEPASGRCDAEIGMLMLALGTRKAHGNYFLDEGATRDDPKADAAFYRRVAEAARRYGRHASAASAMAKVLAREPDAADDWIALSRALQADEARIEEAIAALDEALKRDATNPEIRFERAVLVGQTPDTEGAIAAFEDYLRVAPADAPSIGMAKERLSDLRQGLSGEARPSAEAETKAAAEPDAKADAKTPVEATP